MAGDERLKGINLEHQFDNSKYNCYANSAYRNAMKKTGLSTTNQAGLISNYIYAMVTYEDLKSDENYKHLEKSERKYKEFLSLNR